MKTSNIHAIHSDGYLEIKHFFDQSHPPFTLTHIREFNAIYRRIYPSLGQPERWRAEKFVDYMIDHVEHRDWVCKIYGVV